MTLPAPALAARAPALLRTIVLGGAIVGVLDLIAAVSIGLAAGANPMRVVQSIASGLLGRAAYAGGWQTVAVGLAAHFTIATVVAAVYVLATRAWPAIGRRPLVAGSVYGLLVFATMYGVVLPLVGIRAWPTTASAYARAIGAHLFAVGWPIALWATRCAASPESEHGA